MYTEHGFKLELCDKSKSTFLSIKRIKGVVVLGLGAVVLGLGAVVLGLSAVVLGLGAVVLGHC